MICQNRTINKEYILGNRLLKSVVSKCDMNRLKLKVFGTFQFEKIESKKCVLETGVLKLPNQDSSDSVQRVKYNLKNLQICKYCLYDPRSFQYMSPPCQFYNNGFMYINLNCI